MTRPRRRVLVVDDSPYTRQVLREMLEAEPLVGVVDIAGNGQIALDKALHRPPDLVLLDLLMPVMDGFTFLRLFRRHSAAPVLVVSSLSDLVHVEKSLELGASGFIAKPPDAYRELKLISRELSAKLREHLDGARPAAKAAAPSPTVETLFPVVVIGSSSGGSPTLQYLLTGLPASLTAAVLIAQHLPPGFTQSFAQRLDSLIPHSVREARDGQPLVPGEVVICPGGRNLAVRPGSGRVRLSLEATLLRSRERPIDPTRRAQITLDWIEFESDHPRRLGLPDDVAVDIGTQLNAIIVGLLVDLIATGDIDRLTRTQKRLSSELDERLAAMIDGVAPEESLPAARRGRA